RQGGLVHCGGAGHHAHHRPDFGHRRDGHQLGFVPGTAAYSGRPVRVSAARYSGHEFEHSGWLRGVAGFRYHAQRRLHRGHSLRV
nr:hypothetical protein [Tanacetum cinerariifolium]